MSRFISPLKWKFTSARIATIIGGGLMVISVFLHWIVVGVPMGVGSALGIKIEVIGPLALFLAVLNSTALFLVNPKLRNAIHLITGGIGAVFTMVFIIDWIIADHAIPLWGIFLYFIGGVISAIFGIRGLRRS